MLAFDRSREQKAFFSRCTFASDFLSVASLSEDSFCNSRSSVNSIRSSLMAFLQSLIFALRESSVTSSSSGSDSVGDSFSSSELEV